MDYQEFLRKNRERVNHTLNIVVLACVLAGAGIFVGTAMHLWSNISSQSAIMQTVFIIIASAVMFLANKKFGQTYIPSVIALLSLDLVLGYSANAHIGIYLTYFIVPLLAIAFCDRTFYLSMCAVNYVAMFITVFTVSDYYGMLSLTSNTAENPAISWFISHMVGYTLEYICMTISGLFICNHITKHMMALYDYQSKTLRQFRVMGSATEIFEQIFYINDSNKTYVVKNGKGFDFIKREQVEDALDLLEQSIGQADKERFKAFVDLGTLKDRFNSKNSIEDTFYSMESGYFSAMFISIPGKEGENDREYIFCTRDINEEKARERTLNEIARRDQPTSLFNRRAYEEDFAACENVQNHDIAIVVADIDGLKAANDNLGHLVGDELILAAAGLLNKYFEDIGTVYRVGGDEFHIIIRNEQINVIENRIAALKEEAEKWKGKQENSLSVSVGLASQKEDSQFDLKTIQKLADRRMYEDKAKFYAKNPAFDRRTTVKEA